MSFESAPKKQPVEGKSERKESFADFGLHIGDRFHTREAYREIKNITPDAEAPSQGHIIVERVGKDRSIKTEQISFQHFVGHQDNITYIDRPELPGGVSLTGPQTDAFKHIDNALTEKGLRPGDRDGLLLQRARLIREIAESTNVDKKGREKAEMKERFARDLHELLSPHKGDSLRQLIKRHLFSNSTDAAERTKHLTEKGYSPTTLERIGQETFKRVEELGAMEQHSEYIDSDVLYELQTLPQLVHSTSSTRHSNLTVGASVEVSRQLRKMAVASLESNPGLRTKIFKQHNTRINFEDINKFIEFVNKDPGEAYRRLDALISLASRDRDKEKQYRFIASVLLTKSRYQP